jgi:hypothetical protein
MDIIKSKHEITIYKTIEINNIFLFFETKIFKNPKNNKIIVLNDFYIYKYIKKLLEFY